MKELDEYEIALQYGHYVEREAYAKLLRWKQEDARDHKAVFLRGARRVGKTVLALEFAHKEYQSFIKVSFDRASDDVKNLFVNYLEDLDGFYDRLSFAYETKLYPGKSLIILDEVQLFTPARQAIKTLLIDNRYDILETGSLASIVKAKENARPYLLPSEEVKIDICPITFKEFLLGSGQKDLVEFIEKTTKSKKPFSAAYRTVYRQFREYLFVGGMPRCVSVYLKTKDLEKTECEKRGIVELYYDDFSQQKNVNPLYLTSIFDQIPSELSQHDKTFRLTHVNPSARIREYGSSFTWLKDADLVNLCQNSNDPSVLPSLTSSGDDLKAYFLDTGLLYTLCFMKKEQDEFFYKSIILDKLHINEGMFAENYVAQVLRSKGYRSLFYYEKRDEATRRSVMEIDFLFIDKRKIGPIEVKSSDAYNLTSIKKFKKTFAEKVTSGIVVYDGDFKTEDGIQFVPIFALDWYL